ncbi:uncharacterized protein DUF4019 [Pseudoduganella flava]|uniref:DUF4019 domain-containing protein n=1 Tax=Pseudoduganella flava TaxID=871742 RepID=A0A562PVI4_9BURK|nr:DUF4019 domain-containing protein [Pseudoduganella flava]QGZ39559.1 DUF4019 domain-containing protein [Pseudoduganella flava]TWI48455.1 uncharacterized protein DUF4019 [Pseudoduganella flava]
MKLLAALLFSTASLSLAPFAHAQGVQPPQDPQVLAAAQQAAEQWLAVVDEGRYTASWEQGAQVLKNAVSVAQWEKGMRDARMPVGTVQGRTLMSSVYATTLPGAPRGHYVVLQYASRFTDRANAIETVTPTREEDGTWRVAGYFIR